MNSRYVFIRFTQNYLSDFVGAGLAGLLELKSDFRIGLSGDDSGTLDRLMEMIVRETGSGRDFSEHLLQHYVHSAVLVCARNLSAIGPVQERVAEGRSRLAELRGGLQAVSDQKPAFRAALRCHSAAVQAEKAG